MTQGTASRSRRVYLGQPGYGKQTAASGRSLWRARRNMDDVIVEHRNSSLLAANFNGLWCNAMNVDQFHGGIGYFAMLHDDIGAEDFWLDTLIDELEARDLDVLGVAVPIKDQNGLTSLAIDGDSTWRIKCRLTTAEVLGLPETFTSEDVGGRLLLNTGCWVCRWDFDWCRKLHFTINDRIVFDRARGEYRAEVEPEDWFFSRLCHELGLRVGATRKIAVSHRGEWEFDNQHAWGSPFDREYVAESQIPEPFPYDVDGWLYPQEGAALAEFARGKRVLEIGSWCGRSTVCLARSAAHVTAVDYFDSRGTAETRNTRDEFEANLTRYGVRDRVQVVHPEGEIPLPGYDFVFIDGAHDRDSVQKDIEKSLAVLNPGGLIAFHDYRATPGEFDGAWDADVTAVVDEFVASGAELVARHRTLAVVRPPATVSV